MGVAVAVRKIAIRWVFIVIALGLLVAAVIASWDSFVAALRDLDPWLVAGAGVCCLAGLFMNGLSWRAIMRSVGLEVPHRDSTRVFMISQVGKYVPGAVWPVLTQAEFARDHGISRARSVTASVVAMLVGVVMSGVVGVLGLILSDPTALSRNWWALLVALMLLACLVPAVLRRIVGLAFRVTRRTDDPVDIRASALAASAAWSLGMWLLLGLQAWLLLVQLAPEADFALATGAFAFSWLVGFLVVVAPGGLGAREAALTVALSSLVGPSAALSLALVSRVLMTLADAVGLLVGLLLTRRGPSTSTTSGD